MTDSNDDRTSARGFYHYAQSFREAADALAGCDFRSTHPDQPRTFLYFHAIELFLKSYLRDAGLSVEDLRDIGHRYGKLAEAFATHGGALLDEDMQLISLIGENGTWQRSRYIETGAFRTPTLDALSGVASRLAHAVCERLEPNHRPLLSADLKTRLT
jgi:hypothetical protein